MSLTTQQQTDLDLWKQNQSQKLPDSLQNLFIEDCLEELRNNEKTRDIFCKNFRKEVCKIQIGKLQFTTILDNSYYYCNFNLLDYNTQTLYILTLLSRTPDGKANCKDCGGQGGEIDRFNHSIFNKCLICNGKGKITTKGQAVMSFLNLEINGDEKTDFKWIKENAMAVNHNDIENALYSAFDMGLGCKQKTTLDHLLYREFTEALRVGKTFETALETINLIYINNIYV